MPPPTCACSSKPSRTRRRREDSRAAATVARPSWKWAVSVAAIALAGALAAAYGAWRLKPEPARAVTRLSIPLPEGQQFSNIGRPILALSPDGTNLVYVANRRLYVRPMSGFESRPIAGSEQTGAVLNPVFSPDGQSVAFASVGDAALKRLPISGGAPVTICKIDALFGLRWSEDGIVFGQPKGILRVSPDGGTPEVIASAGADEMVEAPQMLPGGRAVLFSVKKIGRRVGQGPDRRAEPGRRRPKNGDRRRRRRHVRSLGSSRLRGLDRALCRPVQPGLAHRERWGRVDPRRRAQGPRRRP